MANWEDVASKFLDFLQKPSGLGVFVVCVLIGAAVYAYPLWIVTQTSRENTDRLENAISTLGANCMRSVAYIKLHKQSE